MVRLTAPNGANVDVAAERVESLVRRGFTKPAVKKAAAKKSTAKKSSK